MSVVVSSQDLVTLFVGLELATIPLYVMTAFYRTEEPSPEAAMKYIVVGSLATALILFGYSLFYGAVGRSILRRWPRFAAAHPTTSCSSVARCSCSPRSFQTCDGAVSHVGA